MSDGFALSPRAFTGKVVRWRNYTGVVRNAVWRDDKGDWELIVMATRDGVIAPPCEWSWFLGECRMA